MGMVWNVFQNWVPSYEIPSRISVLFRDLVAFRKDALFIGCGSELEE